MENSLKLTLKRLKANEPLISIILGIFVLAVAAIILAQQLKPTRPRIESGVTTSVANDIALETGVVDDLSRPNTEVKANERPALYVIQPGDSLWIIAERYYDNGFNWIDLAKTNGLGTGDDLVVGQEISIPDAPKRDDSGVLLENIDISPHEVLVQATILGDAHVVVQGESLWSIAQTVYGDGIKWTKIYTANSDIIRDPNRIEVGQELRVPV